MLLLKHSTAVLCAVFIITGAVSGEEVKKAVGDTVYFRPDKLGSPVTSITWKQINGGTIKAIEWDDDGFFILNPRFQVITTLDEKTGQITITNLKVEHSGVYTIDINSKEQQQRFSLTVMERVPKPVITIEKGSNPDVVYLRCEYSEMIIWKNSAGNTLEGKKNHNPGEFITVTNTRTPGNYYTCTLKNAVSEATSDPVYERNLFVIESNAGLIAGIVIGVLLLLIAIILIYLLVKPVHERVNKICSCIPKFFGPLDCLLKKEGEPKDSPLKVVDSEPLKMTASPSDEKPQ